MGKAYRSPFRQERNPSFNIFYSQNYDVLYKDFVLGTGDCISFVARLFGLDRKQAISRIYEDLVLFYIGSEKVAEKIIQPEKKPPIEIKVDKIPWENAKEHILYWQQYGVSVDTLKAYMVSPIASYHTPKYSISNLDLAFTYLIFYDTENMGYKIYRPNANKKDKWRCNVRGNVIRGVKQLAYRDPLIITKAYKDVMVLRELGFDAVSLMSEASPWPDTDKAKELIQSYEDIYVLYDDDEAGRNGARKITSAIPEAINIKIVHERAKDISDLVKEIGKEEAKKILINLLK